MAPPCPHTVGGVRIDPAVPIRRQVPAGSCTMVCIVGTKGSASTSRSCAAVSPRTWLEPTMKEPAWTELPGRKKRTYCVGAVVRTATAGEAVELTKDSVVGVISRPRKVLAATPLAIDG